MSLSSYCRNCGAPAQTTADLSALHCSACEEARKAAMTTFTTENPNALETAKLYAGRQALMQRATHPHQTFINPRNFNPNEIPRR